jgi:hypothetical protein
MAQRADKRDSEPTNMKRAKSRLKERNVHTLIIYNMLIEVGTTTTIQSYKNAANPSEVS